MHMRVQRDEKHVEEYYKGDPAELQALPEQGWNIAPLNYFNSYFWRDWEAK